MGIIWTIIIGFLAGVAMSAVSGLVKKNLSA